MLGPKIKNNSTTKMYRWPDDCPITISGFCNSYLMASKVKAFPGLISNNIRKKTPPHDFCNYLFIFFFPWKQKYKRSKRLSGLISYSIHTES